ncbi:SANT/Myb domain [Dillenia turbinata]|uniref:SANT/Myb domain n=1 Tax=Dillenia turbinata TaxID=194707 RepID=A0AAN8W6T6_9MAGN
MPRDPLRYTVKTMLALLQEVALFPDAKIDWSALVKKSSTGISNPREYQMLWRHLAYRHILVDKLEDGAQPLDDDSDLECELEVSPSITSDASTEAAAYVKVLIASGSPSDSRFPNSSTVEAPLIINIPNGQSQRAFEENSQSTSGINITVPVTVQKQPLPSGTSGEGNDVNVISSGNLPPRKKRKKWSEEEDMELIAAVQKCGEGNWANILKGDFKGDRTASQLSQRWSIIRKRGLNPGGATSNGSLLSEAQLAARRAVSLALDRPTLKDSFKNAGIGAASTSNTASRCLAPPVLPPVEVSPVGTSVSPAQQNSQQPSNMLTSPRSGALSSASKPRVASKKTSTKSPSPFSSNSMLKAAAFAAGARIATPSDAASLLKAAQSKKAVHIMPGGSLIKSSMQGGASPVSTTHLGAHPNVHYIRTGLAAKPSYSPPSISRPNGNAQVQGNSMKSAGSMGQLAPATAISPDPTPSNAVTTELDSENTSKKDSKVDEETSPESDSTQKENVQDVLASTLPNAPNGQGHEDLIPASEPNPEPVLRDRTVLVENSTCTSNEKVENVDQGVIVEKVTIRTQSANGNGMPDLHDKIDGDDVPALKEASESEVLKDKPDDLKNSVM